MDVIRELAMEMKVYETEMGFTPAARSRISAPSDTPRDNDPWADIAG
jgi:phage terminase small subunit